MEFYNKKVTETVKKDIREFLKQFDIRVTFCKRGWSCADGKNSKVRILFFKDRTVKGVWSDVFHELMHVICYRTEKYKNYHHGIFVRGKYSSKKTGKYIRKMGIRAEIYVDKKAQELMKIYFPDIPYITSYRTKEDRDWYRKWVERSYPLK